MSMDRSDSEDIVEVSLDDLLAELRAGPGTTPTDEEATAIAAALSTHLTDRQRAAAAAAAEDATETVSDWTLAGRFDAVGNRARRRPRGVERGSEWKAAARSL
jgi:hypothetical protein